MELVRFYVSYDGFTAGASRVYIQEDGSWTLGDLNGHMTAGQLDEFRAFLQGWAESATSLANGWAEPEFGGCTAPICMAAVRIGDLEIHCRKGEKGEEQERHIRKLVDFCRERFDGLETLAF